MIRKELGGYFPKDGEKQGFFGYLYAAFAKRQEKKRRWDKLKSMVGR